jgi:hypothetical protein
MPRVLTAEWHRVPARDRTNALERWRTRRDRLAAAGVRHWLFVSGADSETYLEFTEAGDAAALQTARAESGLPTTVPILSEVELP